MECYFFNLIADQDIVIAIITAAAGMLGAYLGGILR